MVSEKRMSEQQNTLQNALQKMNAGLCSSCANARLIESDRGSVFIMCKLSFVEPRFAKYPRLPVLACSGYASTGSGAPRATL